MAFTSQRYQEIDAELQRLEEYLNKLAAEMAADETTPSMRDLVYWSLVRTVGNISVLRAQFRTKQGLGLSGDEERQRLSGGYKQ
jgi:hypothetical protein